MLNPWAFTPLTAGGLAYATLTLLPKPERPATAPVPPAPYVPGADRKAPAEHPQPVDSGPLTKAAAPIAEWLVGKGLPRQARRRDLALLDRSTATYLAQQIASATGFCLIGLLLFLTLCAEGFKLPAAWLLAFTGIPGLYGATAPGRSVRTEAEGFREQLCYATGNLLTLTSICLAAGGGISEALAAAADAGEGPAPQHLRDVVTYAHAAGDLPWDALGELGHRAEVPELVELAAAVTLNGTEGTRLRAALSTKATSLRERLLTAREQAEQAACEKAALPTGLLMLGYLILIGFPAATTVLTSL